TLFSIWFKGALKQGKQVFKKLMLARINQHADGLDFAPVAHGGIPVYPFAYMFQAKVPKFPFIAKKIMPALQCRPKVLRDRGSGASVNVRFTPKSGHWNAVVKCPLCAKSGRATARETVAYFSTAPPLSAQSLNPPRLKTR